MKPGTDIRIDKNSNSKNSDSKNSDSKNNDTKSIDSKSSDSKSTEELREKRYKDLTETTVAKLITRLSIPTIISMLVTAIYNAADTFFVGRISTEATAAVGLSFSVMAIIQSAGFFYGQGSGNYLSRMLGKGELKEAEEISATGFALSLITGIIFALVTVLFIRPIAVFLGASGSAIKDTEDYLRIIVLGAPFMMTQFVLNNQLRYQGSAMYAMVGLLSGAVFNVALDPILIFGFGLGVKGAAISTVTGQVLSFAVLYFGTTKGVNIQPKLLNIRFTRHYVFQIVNGGVPALFRQGLAALSIVLLNRAAGFYGTAAIAGMSVTTRVTMFVSSALIGFGQGYQPVCAFNYGAGKTDRVKKGYFFCLKYGTIFLTLISILCIIFAPQIIRFFRDDPEVVKVGMVALRWQSAVLPLLPCIVITNMMLQSIGKGLKASVTSSARSGLCFIPLILILPRIFGLFGVEITQSLSDLISISISIPLAFSELKKM